MGNIKHILWHCCDPLSPSGKKQLCDCQLKSTRILQSVKTNPYLQTWCAPLITSSAGGPLGSLKQNSRLFCIRNVSTIKEVNFKKKKTKYFCCCDVTWGVSTAPGCRLGQPSADCVHTVQWGQIFGSLSSWSLTRSFCHVSILYLQNAACNDTSFCFLVSQTDAPSKPVERPYKRLSAQEVCYQRMQMAQQQAAQLSAAAKAERSSHSSSPGFSGERKRIAHRPNPQITSSKTRMSVSDLEFSQVLCVFKVHV